MSLSLKGRRQPSLVQCRTQERERRSLQGDGGWTEPLTEPETQCLWEEELHTFAAAPRVSPRLSPLSSKVVKAKKSKKDPVNFGVKVEFDMMNSPLDQFMGFNSGLVKTEDFY